MSEIDARVEAFVVEELDVEELDDSGDHVLWLAGSFVNMVVNLFGGMVLAGLAMTVHSRGASMTDAVMGGIIAVFVLPMLALSGIFEFTSFCFGAKSNSNMHCAVSAAVWVMILVNLVLLCLFVGAD